MSARLQKNPQRCFYILGSGQHSHSYAWIGLQEALDELLVIGLPPCSHWEENLLCAVSTAMAEHAAGVSASSQHLVPLPWHWWGEELERFGVCLLLGWGLDICHKHCDFGRSVCFFAALLAGESLQYQVRVSVGLQSAPTKMPLFSREAGPCCLRACFYREELLCISPSFLPSMEGLFTPPWKGTKPCCRRALSTGQGKGGLCTLNSALSAAQRLPPELFIPKLIAFNFFSKCLLHLQLRRALLLGKGRKIFDNTLTSALKTHLGS